jgi:ribonuclease T
VSISQRFRGFLPVIIDIETGGFSAATDAILEIAASIVRMDSDGVLHVHATHDFHVVPFEGANIEQSALDFTGIDPYHPFREAVPEREAFLELFQLVRRELREQECNRAILVAHNAHFDAGFSMPPWSAAISSATRSTPSPISTPPRSPALPTARRCWRAAAARRVSSSTTTQAHSAAYDAERTGAAVLHDRQSLAGAREAGPQLA